MGIPRLSAPKVPTVSLATLALLVTACSDWPSFRTDPVLRANPNLAVRLAAVLEFESDSPATVLIDVTDGDNSWRLEYGPENGPANGLPVVGMRPGRWHEVRISLRSASGL